jgi:hypothetical protein
MHKRRSSTAVVEDNWIRGNPIASLDANGQRKSEKLVYGAT